MKNQVISLIFLFSVIMINLYSCNKDREEPCISEEIESINLEIDPLCNLFIIDEKLEDQFLMINNKQELNSSINFEDQAKNSSCEKLEMELNQIDFSKNTLLIGKKVVTGIQASLIDQTFLANCKNQGSIYTLHIKNGGFTAMGLYKFAIVIPKQSKPVKFDIRVSN